MKKCVSILLILIPYFVFSQQQVKSDKMHFGMITTAGITIGEQKVSPVFQIINGIRISKYFAGIGIGLDEYRFRSLPVFADVRINFGKNDFAFVYADAGYNFPAGIKKEEVVSKTTDIYKGSFYMDAGVGLRILSAKKHALLLSAGYSRKDVRHTLGYTYVVYDPPGTETIYHDKYSLERIAVKLSWQFGRR